MRENGLKGKLLLVLLAAAWGGTFPVMKIAILDLDVFFFLLLRFGVALLSFIPLLIISKRRTVPDIRGVGLGFVVFSGFLFQVFGLKYTTAINSAFITSLNTPLVPVLGFLLFRKKPSTRAVLGIILGMIGLVLLTEVYKGIVLSTGDFLTFICAISWALQIILVDVVTKEVDALELAYSESTSAFLLSILSSLAVRERWKLPAVKGTLAVMYTGLIATTFAFFAQAWSQERVSPELTGLILLLEPVFATFLSFLILRETLSLIEALGALLILLGVGISE
ncbi:MAG TPA: DMT family transporter [Candidatus Korarchaeota archaeon]|nr:DMT family transporter [Candidatus Korarchaeota archaeon]